MDKDKIFLKILQENMLYMRHQETQRMWTANIFIAIVVGTLVYSINTGIEEIPWFIPFVFLIVSTLCFLITLKLSHVFAKTQKSIEHIFEDNNISKVQSVHDWRYYMEGIKSKKRIWKILRIRHLYLVFYASAIAGSGYWLHILDGPGDWIPLLIASLIVIVVMIFAIRDWSEDKKGQNNTNSGQAGQKSSSETK